MGAQRWLDFYFFNFQPSELMRIILIIALAKYFSFFSTENIRKISSLIAPILLIMAPILFVLIQPDLGTAMIFLLVSASIFFVCGVQIWKFAVVILAGIATAPILWNFLHEYQKNRILMFLSPEIDPNGAGYHIIQSKIALGSGGFWGKGLMNGTQCQLDFLPEKQTDFMFATLGEELGFIGCLFLMFLYFLLLIYNFCVFLRERGKFNQFLVFGLNAMLFFYIFINVAMVCGLLPVVGIPLPFFSYGGSALIVLMICQGLIFSIDIEQKYLSSRFI
jgi:rod shape determining protein RodA